MFTTADRIFNQPNASQSSASGSWNVPPAPPTQLSPEEEEEARNIATSRWRDDLRKTGKKRMQDKRITRKSREEIKGQERTDRHKQQREKEGRTRTKCKREKEKQ